MAKLKLTAEQQFFAAWEEYGYGGSDVEREFKFHPTRRWRLDAAWPSRRVGVEIDGRGRHQTVAGVRSDCEKANAAVELGWVILRIPTSDIRGKNKLGEPLLELFIELVCRVLFNRENYADKESVDKEVAKLPSLPPSPKCKNARPLSGKHSSGGSTNWGGSWENRGQAR